MTEQDNRERDQSDATESAEAMPEDDQGDQGEQDEDDKDEDDGKSEKSDKAKKVKINFEAAMPRNEAVSYFEAIVGGLRSGRLEFKQDGDSLVLSPPEQLEVEVKAQAKGDKAKIVFEIAWSGRALEISS